jgi:hypothetical protein
LPDNVDPIRLATEPALAVALGQGALASGILGVSEDPQKRLEQHNQALKGWTARHKPWTLVHTEASESYTAAQKRELQLKAHKGGRGFFLTTGLPPEQFGRGS